MGDPSQKGGRVIGQKAGSSFKAFSEGSLKDELGKLLETSVKKQGSLELFS